MKKVVPAVGMKHAVIAAMTLMWAGCGDGTDAGISDGGGDAVVSSSSNANTPPDNSWSDDAGVDDNKPLKDAAMPLDAPSNCYEIYRCIADGCSIGDQSCYQQCYENSTENAQRGLEDYKKCMNNFCPSPPCLGAVMCGRQYTQCFYPPTTSGIKSCTFLVGCLDKCTSSNDISCKEACYTQGSDLALKQFAQLQLCFSGFCNNGNGTLSQTCVEQAAKDVCKPYMDNCVSYISPLTAATPPQQACKLYVDTVCKLLGPCAGMTKTECEDVIHQGLPGGQSCDKATGIRSLPELQTCINVLLGWTCNDMTQAAADPLMIPSECSDQAIFSLDNVTPTTPQQACDLYVDAACSTIAPCDGITHFQCEDLMYDGFPGGKTCSSVSTVRSLADLKICVGKLLKFTCADWKNVGSDPKKIPSECQAQFNFLL